MNIAVLSGKGGTGKTFVSCNLASAIGKSAYIDCCSLNLRKSIHGMSV